MDRKMTGNDRSKLHMFSNNSLRVTIHQDDEPNMQYHIGQIEYDNGDGWFCFAKGCDGREFNTSLGSCNANHLRVLKNDHEGFDIELSCNGDHWHAVEKISAQASEPYLRIDQQYTFHIDAEGYVFSAITIDHAQQYHYTYPLQTYQTRLNRVKDTRCDCAWAVPLPFHILNTDEHVVIYGLDRTQSHGTLDLRLSEDKSSALLGLYYPDSSDKYSRQTSFNEAVDRPSLTRIKQNSTISLSGVIGHSRLQNGQISLLVAEKMAADILLIKDVDHRDYRIAADTIADYYRNCDLWNPDALGPGRGWFRNMWVRIDGQMPSKDSHYDLGWGEGYGAICLCAIVRNWQRTQKTDLLPFADEMSRNVECFRRNADPGELFYDRYNSDKPLWGSINYGFTDFMGSKKIWSHSAAHIGYHLLKLYKDVDHYHDMNIRDIWYATAQSIAVYLGKSQKANGDIQDGFDENNRESNRKKHRITARAAVCGLWALYADITGEDLWIRKALALANVLIPEIEQYAFYNQMLDTHIDGVESSDSIEIADGENACYALQGLVELYGATHDDAVLRLCHITSSYLISWMYFYNVPKGYKGLTRGGTTCRMPDYPLLYVGAGAIAYDPLMKLSEETGDSFYHKIATEILACISTYLIDAPDIPWHGGVVHAYDQRQGFFWGPDREGQVDSGMTSGMCLLDLELYIGYNVN